jgi:hypothetical protein
MSDLEKKIESRKQQARDRNISSKAALIARALGHTDEWDTHSYGSHNEGRRSVYEKDGLRITDEFNSVTASDGGGGCGGSTTIEYKGKKVFEEYGYDRIESYAPGAWEKQFDAVHAEAKKKDASNRRKEAAEARAATARDNQRKRKEINDKWGL